MLAIAGVGISLIVLTAFIATHMGTYNPALTLSLPVLPSHQPDVQPTVSTTTNASAALVRINQADESQYQSQGQHDQWSASACSAAAMTEIINAYGHHYRLGDILAVESSIGAMSPTQGLLKPDGIDQTVLRFGFQTQTLDHLTLDEVLKVANNGHPVLINFPPQPGTIWAGGHFLVLLGGKPDAIHLADSSPVNNGNGLQYVDQAYFNQYWRGEALIITPLAYSIVSDTPSVHADFINKVLSTYHSPAEGQGQALYDLGIKYNIDPVFALAFFGHESTFGTRGEATQSLSLGNLRCVGRGYEDLQPSCRDNYAWFPSWKNGFEAFYRLIAGDLYVGAGLVTPDRIIPRYAPGQDNNNEAGYINALKKSIDRARAGKADIENF
jgi:Mannosyl-glycoprotein endo-beta-N-acetylglucosaminidase/Peptidase C39 family